MDAQWRSAMLCSGVEFKGVLALITQILFVVGGQIANVYDW